MCTIKYKIKLVWYIYPNYNFKLINNTNKIKLEIIKYISLIFGVMNLV